MGQPQVPLLKRHSPGDSGILVFGLSHGRQSPPCHRLGPWWPTRHFINEGTEAQRVGGWVTVRGVLMGDPGGRNPCTELWHLRHSPRWSIRPSTNPSIHSAAVLRGCFFVVHTTLLSGHHR